MTLKQSLEEAKELVMKMSGMDWSRQRVVSGAWVIEEKKM